MAICRFRFLILIDSTLSFHISTEPSKTFDPQFPISTGSNLQVFHPFSNNRHKKCYGNLKHKLCTHEQPTVDSGEHQRLKIAHQLHSTYRTSWGALTPKQAVKKFSMALRDYRLNLLDRSPCRSLELERRSDYWGEDEEPEHRTGEEDEETIADSKTDE